MPAPLNFARFAFSCVSFDDKAEWASVLEPFQLSGGTSGGSEILASIDMAMSSLAPVGWARIKLDFKSFFYRANMKLCVMALKEHKMFKQILQLKAAFAQRGSMVVFYDSADYGKVSFQTPPNGLPPGHPLSSNCVRYRRNPHGIVRQKCYMRRVSGIMGILSLALLN